MKFLFIAPRYHTNQHFWVKSLINHGHKVRFWAWRQELWENHSVLTPDLLPRFWFDFPDPIRFCKNMREFDPDVVVVRDPHSYLFAFILLCVARLQKRKIIVYGQTPLYQKPTTIKRFFVNVAMKVFNASWITPVKGDDTAYSKFHPRAFFVPFAIEVSKLSRAVEPDEGAIRVISVGKLYQIRKNHLLLIRALRRLQNEADLRLTIVGALSGNNPDYFAKINKYLTKHNLHDRVRIKTDLSHQQTLDEYSKHDFFVIPSSNEPLACSPLEAMSAGLPVICSDTNGAKWYVEEGENGYVFKSGNLEDLRAKINLLISNKKKLQEMKRASRRLVETHYTPDLFYQRMMQITRVIR